MPLPADPCDRRLIHGGHTFLDSRGVEHRCPGRVSAYAGSATPLRDRILGPLCGCGLRVFPKDADAHVCAPIADRTEAADLVHARLLDGTVLCPDAILDPDTPHVTVFLDVVTCSTCAGRLARIQGRPTAVPAEARPIHRPGRVLGVAR